MIANTHIDRLPPHSPESEQALLGCIMLDPQAVLPPCLEKLSQDGIAFYDLRHQTIFQTMVELWEDQDPIDPITLSERLKVWDQLEQVGGMSYISQLPDTAPSAANHEAYLTIVLEKYWLRKMAQVCTEVVGRVYDCESDVAEVLDGAERDVLRAAESRVQHDSPSTLQLVRHAIENIEYRSQHQGEVTGIATGFVDFDRLTNGLHSGRMYVIGARPSMGKTSLALNITDHVAVTNNIPVGVFSLEMTGPDLMERMISSRARVNSANLRDGFLADRDYPRITSAAASLSHAPIYIDDTSGLSILQIRAKARRMWQRHGVRLFLVDYLQLANAAGGKRRVENRQQEIADISAGMKSLAKELNVPVVVLAQLNRDIEREKNRKPRLSDLRESGATEQDADLVSFLFQPKNGEEEDGENEEAMPVDWMIQKNRFGPKGVVHLTFLQAYTRFESAARIAQEDVPDEQAGLPYPNDP